MALTPSIVSPFRTGLRLEMASMALARATAVTKNAIGISKAGSFSGIGYDLSKYVLPSGGKELPLPKGIHTNKLFLHSTAFSSTDVCQSPQRCILSESATRDQLNYLPSQ